MPLDYDFFWGLPVDYPPNFRNTFGHATVRSGLELHPESRQRDRQFLNKRLEGRGRIKPQIDACANAHISTFPWREVISPATGFLSHHMPPAAGNANRIALNPDCGFAPDMGEPPSIDEAFEKLCRLAAAAQRLRRREWA
jgi:hypothetical protein